MNLSPKKQKFILNLYPPYIGAGIRINYISHDWRETHISMKLRWYNNNAVGTHFGGSLYSMIDPHLMLMLLQILGKDYLVWDKEAHINFIKPGKSKVSAKIKITDEQIDKIVKMTKEGDKYFPEFLVQIINEDGELVAESLKTLYVRKKKKT